MPCLVITGDDDRIPDCGHIPHEECPEPFLQAVTDFPDKLP